MIYRHSSLVRVVSSVLALLLMGYIYSESSQPLGFDLSNFPYEDKLVHAFVYGVLAGLFLLSQKPLPTGFDVRQQLIAIILSVLYGISDEWHQSFIPSRTSDIWDLVADGVGAVLATLILSGALRRLYSTHTSAQLEH